MSASGYSLHRIVVEEPGRPQAASGLGLHDLVTLGVQLDVVAHAAAERAGRMLNNVQAHEYASRSWQGFSNRRASAPVIDRWFLFRPTGRHDKRSTQFPADATAFNASRLVAAILDHFPGGPLFHSRARREDRLCRLLRSVFKFRLFHFPIRFQKRTLDCSL